MTHALSDADRVQIRSHYADILNDWITGPEEEKQEAEIFNFCSECVCSLNSCLITEQCLSLVLRFAAGLILARQNGEFGPVVDLVIDEGDLLKECLDAFNEKIASVKSTFEESRSQFTFQDDIEIVKEEVAVAEFDENVIEGFDCLPEAGINSENIKASTNEKLGEKEHFEDLDIQPAVDSVVDEDDLPKQCLNEINEKVVPSESLFEEGLRQSTSQEDNQKDNEHAAVINSNEVECLDSSSEEDINSRNPNTKTNKRRRSFLKDGVKYKQCSLAGCNEDYEFGNGAAYAEHERNFHRCACDICGRVFSSRTSFFRHVRLHNGEQAKVKCDICEQTFTTGSSMMVHVREVHDNSVNTFECQYCGIGFTLQKDLFAHLDEHTECKYCDEKLPDRANWINHTRRNHPDKLYTCDQCYHISLSLKLLDRHKRVTHYEDKNDDQYTVYPINNASFHQCPRCSLQFSTEEFLLQHKEQTHAKPQRGTKKQLTINRRSKEEIEKFGLRYTCDICGQMYRIKSSLWNHKYQKHNKPKQTSICDVCGQKFKRESFLYAHMANKHSTELPFRCEHCPRAFSQASLLKEHATSHFAKKLHGCAHCDYRSEQLKTLKDHITRKHTVDRPFKCLICDKGFINNAGLRHHVLVHSLTKPFQCELCEQSFRLKMDVQRHLSKAHADSKGTEWYLMSNNT